MNLIKKMSYNEINRMQYLAGIINEIKINSPKKVEVIPFSGKDNRKWNRYILINNAKILCNIIWDDYGEGTEKLQINVEYPSIKELVIKNLKNIGELSEDGKYFYIKPSHYFEK